MVTPNIPILSYQREFVAAIVISENILFAIESQMYGIVCLKILLLLLQLTLSKIDLIYSGLHRNLSVTSK